MSSRDMKNCGVTAIMRSAMIGVLAVIAVSAVWAQQPSRKRPSSRAAKPKVVISPQISEEEKRQLTQLASQSRANLIAASTAYRESLEKVLELQKQDEARGAELVEKRKKLLDLGVVARKEVEESEQALASTRSKIAETQKQIEEVDHL